MRACLGPLQLWDATKERTQRGRRETFAGAASQELPPHSSGSSGAIEVRAAAVQNPDMSFRGDAPQVWNHEQSLCLIDKER